MAGGWFGRPTARVRAVDGIRFEVARGETFGLVGESGSAKTTADRTLLPSCRRPVAAGHLAARHPHDAAVAPGPGPAPRAK